MTQNSSEMPLTVQGDRTFLTEVASQRYTEEAVGERASQIVEILRSLSRWRRAHVRGARSHARLAAPPCTSSAANTSEASR
jgi:hypothetical protein